MGDWVAVLATLVIGSCGIAAFWVEHRSSVSGPKFVEADDVDPEKRAAIARRVAEQLATQRTLCVSHVFDEHGVCRRCKTTAPISPFVDRHVAFPEERS